MAAARRRSDKTKPVTRHRVIGTQADLDTGVAALIRLCPVIKSIHALAGPPPLRLQASGLPGLVRIIVNQQVSTASGNAIWTRVQNGIVPLSASAIANLSEADLRGLGLSRPKIRTIQALAKSITDGDIDLNALMDAPDDQVRAQLVALHGIGPWTSDIYLMFCLGRADTFAPGDLALQEAVRMAMALDQRPSAAELEVIAQRWQPWRAVAARILWAYYRVMKEGRSVGAPI